MSQLLQVAAIRVHSPDIGAAFLIRLKDHSMTIGRRESGIANVKRDLCRLSPVSRHAPEINVPIHIRRVDDQIGAHVGDAIEASKPSCVPAVELSWRALPSPLSGATRTAEVA